MAEHFYRKVQLERIDPNTNEFPEISKPGEIVFDGNNDNQFNGVKTVKQVRAAVGPDGNALLFNLADRNIQIFCSR